MVKYDEIAYWLNIVSLFCSLVWLTVPTQHQIFGGSIFFSLFHECGRGFHYFFIHRVSRKVNKKNQKNEKYNNGTFSVAYREQLNLFWKKVDFLSTFLGDPVNKKIVETPPTFINKTKKNTPQKNLVLCGHSKPQ